MVLLVCTNTCNSLWVSPHTFSIVLLITISPIARRTPKSILKKEKMCSEPMPQGACTLLLSLTLTHAFAIWLEVAEHSTNTEMDWGAALTVLLLVGVVNIPARQRKSACGWFVATHNFLNAFIIKTALSSVKETCRPSSQAGDDWHFSWKWRDFRAFSGKYLGGKKTWSESLVCVLFLLSVF